MKHPRLKAQVVVIGGGVAGLSAAVYLARAKRDVLVVDSGKSMARWEPEVQNYLGFPDGISGPDLLERGRVQAVRYGTRFAEDRVVAARAEKGSFELQGERAEYACHKLLLATGIFHIPPDLPDVEPCLGHSMFFCKDCDGYRVQGKTVGVYGWTNEAVRYALGMLPFSPCVFIVTDGRTGNWDATHAQLIREYAVPVHVEPIQKVQRRGGRLLGLGFGDGSQVALDALFTTRGDVYFNDLAKSLGARLDDSGEIVVDVDARTTVPGLYAAGCVTPANCQLIIAAGQGATAAQAINTDLFDESLHTHSLKRFRKRQLRTRRTRPAVKRPQRNREASVKTPIGMSRTERKVT